MFNENWFSFFVADHLLVGQLCTNLKSDRSLLSCLKVTQCSTSQIATVQHMLSTDPSYDNRSCCHNLDRLDNLDNLDCQHPQNANLDCHEKQGCAQGEENKVSGYGYGLWCGFKWGPHHATSHLRSQLVRWQTLGVAAGLGAGPQVQRDPGLASEGVLRLCTLLSLAPLLPWPEPAGLLRLVIHQEHHQHDLPQHQSQPDCHHLLSIRRAPAGACGKGMLSVPDPYQGSDWGWRRLHWTDVSSTT